MIYFGLLFLEIIALYFLSRKISKIFSRLMSINILSFIFLPGVIVHELSHLLTAVILFVPVGNMEFVPKKTSEGLKLGSVEIGKTDPARRSIIGFAPVFTGFMAIIGIVYFVTINISLFQDKGFYFSAIAAAITIYVLFAISNTMFASKRDMEGAIEVLLTLIIVFAIAYIIGFRPSFSFAERVLTKDFFELIKKAEFFLLVPILIDLLILGTIESFIYIRSRMF